KGLSSGMVARLAFAIATDIHPDILVVDEVLSVGDEKFKQKSKQKMDELWNDNTTVLVVSHSMAFIQESCDSAIWISQGRIQSFGRANIVVDSYLSSL
ncbi:MAG: ABC transporter ATP-binding protein, partial [Bacteroidota bacterium]